MAAVWEPRRVEPGGVERVRFAAGGPAWRRPTPGRWVSV